MTDWLSTIVLFAEGEAPKAAPPQSEMFTMLFPLIAIGILFYFMLFRPERRKQAVRQAMLAALKKNDRVVTIGGMIGTVANISADGEEVTLKVDDNTRVRMVRSSIQSIMSADTEDKPAM